mmetsp:Transcript_26312/g.44923  ORF Transcript_26312/g.44923 Transcript_26312/m.44923 type:complete len:218 (+) Transcript_26312:339-992(+)
MVVALLESWHWPDPTLVRQHEYHGSSVNHENSTQLIEAQKSHVRNWSCSEGEHAAAMASPLRPAMPTAPTAPMQRWARVYRLLPSGPSCFCEKSAMPMTSPMTRPPRCMKLSTKGVRPMKRLTAVDSVKVSTPEPRSVHLAAKLTSTSAQHAPMSPKTEAEAPTEITPGRKTTETIVPKRPEATYSRAMRTWPKRRSSPKPSWTMAMALHRKWKTPA